MRFILAAMMMLAAVTARAQIAVFNCTEVSGNHTVIRDKGRPLASMEYLNDSDVPYWSADAKVTLIKPTVIRYKSLGLEWRNKPASVEMTINTKTLGYIKKLTDSKDTVTFSGSCSRDIE